MPTSLDSLLEPCQKLQVLEARARTDSYYEAVIASADLPLWVQGLDAGLGAALKPAGAAPNGEAKKLTEAFGGIRKDQTLYYKVLADCKIMAMFWPWGGNERTTLKVWKLPPA